LVLKTLEAFSEAAQQRRKVRREAVGFLYVQGMEKFATLIPQRDFLPKGKGKELTAAYLHKLPLTRPFFILIVSSFTPFLLTQCNHDFILEYNA